MDHRVKHKFVLGNTNDTWIPIDQSPGTASVQLQAQRGSQPFRLTKWRGAPGIYERPYGSDRSETFVVYAGSGFLLTAEETVRLAPGVVIDVKKGVPYVLEIIERLEKFAVISI